MCLAFEMKTFCVSKGVISKIMTRKLCQNAHFENGDIAIQVSILYVLLNILSISSLPRVHGTSVIFKMQKE